MQNTNNESDKKNVSPSFDNVILLGAGSSSDAGIPLLCNFVECMWEYAMRGKVGQEPIPGAALAMLTEANNIRKELASYQSRANFDDRNLEDILSILSFEAFSGQPKWIEKREILVEAISLTIELSCKLKVELQPPQKAYIEDHITNIYHALWKAFFSETLQNSLPAILTFNYDLVLERSLWQYFHQMDYASNSCPKSVCLKYYYDAIHDCKISGATHTYQGSSRSYSGRKAVFISSDVNEIECTIPYLKLHGSLNWERKNDPKRYSELNWIPTKPLPNPFILPPVFNKLNDAEINQVWNKALSLLRHAKNLIIIGYSLPSTDVYMQYFLKSGIGPNGDLNKIIVFDPELFKDNEKAEAMRKRYSECFSPQLQSRIKFQPDTSFGEHFFEEKVHGPIKKGSLGHFVKLLTHKPEEVFFYSR